jgi:hypothetical protein
MKFYDKHEGFCNLLHQIYKEKEDLVDCLECKSLIKFAEYNKHKDTCPAIKKKVEDTKCTHCGLNFPIDIIDEHEVQCEKILTEKMLLKEKIECSFCKESVPFSVIELHESTCLKLKENQEMIEKVSMESKIELPLEWGDSPKDLELVDVDQNSEDWGFCENLFKKSVPNVTFTRIQMVKNKYLWEKYAREKIRIVKEKGHCEENFLFHGTRQNNPEIVYTTGFDISFSSDGGSYGRGIYFARRALYSASGYAYLVGKKNYMFLAKVLTGMCIQTHGGAQLRKPPFCDQAKFIYYDSVTNNQNKNNSYDVDQMIIVYNNEKAYPYYLMEYEYNNNNVNNNPGIIGNIYNNKINLVKQPYVNPNLNPNIKQKPRRNKKY